MSSFEPVEIYGFIAPQAFDASFVKPSLPQFSATIQVRVSPKHGPVPVALRVNSRSDDAYSYRDALRLLKGVNLDDLLLQALHNAIRSVEWQGYLDELGKSDGRTLTPGEYVALAKRMEGLNERLENSPKPQRRRSVTPELLETVATVYRQAVDAAKAPTKAVADHFEVSHASAARWVREARKAGTLGPSRGPMPGEALTEN